MLRFLIIIYLSFSCIIYANSEEVVHKDNRLDKINKTLSLVNISFGPAKFETENPAYYLQIRNDFDINDNASALMSWDFVLDEKYNSFSDVSIGGRFFPISDKAAPFLGANLGLGALRLSNINKFGFTFGVQAGVQFFRDSDLHLEIAINYKRHLKYDSNIFGFVVGLSAPFIF